MTFGEKILKIRQDNNLSQEEMAELLDVSRQTISKWESDKGFPETKRLIFISKHFHVSLDELMLDDEMREEPRPEKISLKNSIIHMLDNLSEKQKLYLYILVIAFLVLFVLLLTYFLGECVGRAAYHILH